MKITVAFVSVKVLLGPMGGHVMHVHVRTYIMAKVY